MTVVSKRLWFLLIAILLASFATPVRASETYAPEQKLSNIAIDPIEPFVTGTHPTVTVRLTAQYGKPIPKQPITILVNGKRKARVLTDSRGIATATLKFKFAAGTYSIVAIYPGIPTIGLPSATAKTDMDVQPARLAIYTVPATPGVVFKLGDRTFTTDEKGMTILEASVSGAYSLDVLPIDPEKLPANIRMEFARWNDNLFTSSRKIYLPRTRRLEAGFTVKYQVSQVFHDTEGQLVDPARISSIMIRGAGRTFTFDKAGPIWLPANQLNRRIGERLESDEILYYFRDVTIDGANVINKSEQRFRIQPDDVWPVQVLLYSAHFSARDAMFHRPIGKGIELTYPNGHTQEFLFDSSATELTIPDLARGSYSARIIGAGGSSPLTPIHLSRDQDVELLIFSYFDMGVLLTVGMVIALGLLLLGRPYIGARAVAVVSRTIPLRRRSQPAS